MKFTYMLPSEENPRLEYPVSFYINLDRPELHPDPDHEPTSFLGSAYKYPDTRIDGLGPRKTYSIYGTIPKDPSKKPDMILYYEGHKIHVMDFVWPGCRTDDVMFPIFLETYSENRREKNFYTQYLYLEYDVVMKCLLKFRSKIILYCYSGTSGLIEGYDINKNRLVDLIDGKPILLSSVKGNPALNFTLYANDLVDMLKDGIIFIRKK